MALVHFIASCICVILICTFLSRNPVRSCKTNIYVIGKLQSIGLNANKEQASRQLVHLVHLPRVVCAEHRQTDSCIGFTWHIIIGKLTTFVDRDKPSLLWICVLSIDYLLILRIFWDRATKSLVCC